MRKVLAAIILMICFTIPAYAETVKNIDVSVEIAKNETGKVVNAVPFVSEDAILESWSVSPDPSRWDGNTTVFFKLFFVPSASKNVFDREETAVNTVNGSLRMTYLDLQPNGCVMQMVMLPNSAIDAPSGFYADGYNLKWKAVNGAKYYEVELSWTDSAGTRQMKTVKVSRNNLDLTQTIGYDTNARIRTIPSEEDGRDVSAWTSLDAPIKAEGLPGKFVNMHSGMYFETDNGRATGWQKINGFWYYFDPAQNGRAALNEWKDINGRRYRFSAKGIMNTGWYSQLIDGKKYQFYLDPHQGAEEGMMHTGWVQTSADRWYWLNDGTVESLPLGAVLTDGTTPDGYKVDASGLWDGRPANR